jgi:hypothetical protein
MWNSEFRMRNVEVGMRNATSGPQGPTIWREGGKVNLEGGGRNLGAVKIATGAHRRTRFFLSMVVRSVFVRMGLWPII